MTRSTKDQRFAAASRHDFHPSGLFTAWIFFQIFECPDMVDFDAICQTGGSALLTYLREQSFFQFGSSHRLMRRLVVKVCFHIPLE
jgi:hypothetical protein